MTFSQCAGEYIESHKAGWKGQKHVKTWKGSLKGYAEPIIGEFVGRRRSTPHWCLKVFKPIWETKTEDGRETSGIRIEMILNWAKTHGYRDGENPARWRGHIENALPDPSKIAKVKHLAAMPYASSWASCVNFAQDGHAGRGAGMDDPSAVRSDNTFAAIWPEIDLDKRVWTIPGERMKVDSDFRVPLTNRAIEILKRLDRSTKFIFSGENPKKKLPHEKMLKALKALRPGLTVHGFRSTFRDWAAEQTRILAKLSRWRSLTRSPGKTEFCIPSKRSVRKAPCHDDRLGEHSEIKKWPRMTVIFSAADVLTIQKLVERYGKSALLSAVSKIEPAKSKVGRPCDPAHNCAAAWAFVEFIKNHRVTQKKKNSTSLWIGQRQL